MRSSSQQRREGRRVENCLGSVAKSAHADTDDDDRDRSEKQKQNRLKRVDPGGAAHPAEEHVAHDDKRDDSAAKPVRHPSAADGVERSSAAHNADDDVGNQQYGLDCEDDGADVVHIPSDPETSAPAS